MNVFINQSIITLLESEVCPVHGSKAKVSALNDVLEINGACCPEFYNHLVERSHQLIEGDAQSAELLKRFLGVR